VISQRTFRPRQLRQALLALPLRVCILWGESAMVYEGEILKEQQI
jgi:hypothetical protein